MKRDEELRGIVNSSHTIDGGVLRCVGDNYELRKFSTWAPMALAGIGRLAETIMDRSIVISMKRRTEAEAVEDINGAALATFETLARKAARWADGMEGVLSDYCPPDLPDGMIRKSGFRQDLCNVTTGKQK